jgi:hypothetical protein
VLAQRGVFGPVGVEPRRSFAFVVNRQQFGPALARVVLDIPTLPSKGFAVLGETDVADGGLRFRAGFSDGLGSVFIVDYAQFEGVAGFDGPLESFVVEVEAFDKPERDGGFVVAVAGLIDGCCRHRWFVL